MSWEWTDEQIYAELDKSIKAVKTYSDALADLSNNALECSVELQRRNPQTSLITLLESIIACEEECWKEAMLSAALTIIKEVYSE